MKYIKSRHHYRETVNYIKSLSNSICSIISSKYRSGSVYCISYKGNFTFYCKRNKSIKTYTVSPSLSSMGSYTLSEHNNNKIENINLLSIEVSRQLFSVKISIRGSTKDENDVYDFLLRRGI